MNGEAIFSRRAVLGLAVAGGVGLAVTLAYMVFGEPAADVESAGADSFSRSALGYRALVELLEGDVPVVVSRRASESKASATAPLLLLEPPADEASLERLARMLGIVRGRQATAVVVLPKWRGWPADEPPGWVSRVAPRDVDEPRRVLETVLDAEAPDVRRGSSPFELPAAGDTAYGAVAKLPSPQLLAAGGRLETVLGDGRGTLVARLSGTAIYVVSDPDLLNTAGLARGENATVAHQLLVGRLEPEAFVVDETLHGFGRGESIWRALLEFPLVCLTLHLATLLALVLWSTTGRFGRPLRPPSRLPPGKLTLLANTTRLLALAAHSRYALKRYLELTVRTASDHSALSGQLAFRQRVERLSRLGENRGVGENLGQLAWEVGQLPAEEAEPRRILRLAHALYRWRREFLGKESG